MATNAVNKRPTVIVFADYYLPGFKAGGALRSLANLVEQLGDEFDIRIVTRDHDVGESAPYGHIRQGVWEAVGKARVFYLSAKLRSWWEMICLILDARDDVIYFNSLFSLKFTLFPFVVTLLLKKKAKIILAPRGELGCGALSLKSFKKNIYIYLLKLTGMINKVVMQASSDLERRDIVHRFPGAQIYVAGDLSSPISVENYQLRPAEKQIGRLRIVFLSRIARVKNLHLALQWVRQLEGEVVFDIYGPIEDELYWDECRNWITGSELRLMVTYKGTVDHEDVPSVLSQYHLFLLPTAGENFGHVILEALQSGCMVLISDRTPWQSLESSGAGWCRALERPTEFLDVLEHCLNMEQEEFSQRSHCARLLGKDCGAADLALQQNRSLFGGT